MPSISIKRLVATALATLTVSALSVPVVSAGEVSLTGEGSVQYTPDSARLQFTATAQNALAAKATDEVAEQMAKWRKAIKKLQPELQDYSDAQVNLYNRTQPPQERGQQGETVAVASQTVSFTIKDLDLLNPLLKEAQAIGLTYNLGPHQFFHSDQKSLEEQALARAIADARSRCQFAAKQLDLSCGEVVTLNINGGYRPVPMRMAEAKGAADVVSSVGPRELSASVSATFKLD